VQNHSTPTNFGASKNPMLTIANPAVTFPNWALPADQSVNYIAGTITRTELKAGAKLYRVYGGPASMTGAYWSPDKPDAASEGEWRSVNAVEPWWNAGTHVAELTVNAGSTLHVWAGGITSQPALYANGDKIRDYFLKGGGQQCFVQTWLSDVQQSTTIVAAGDTPWPSAPTDERYRVVPNVRPEGDPGTLDFTDPVQHVAIQLYSGGAVMRDLAKVLDKVHSTNKAAAGGPADMAADNMITLANAVLRNLHGDPEAARHAAMRAAGLRRVINIDTTMLTGADAIVAQQADAMVTIVVNAATALVG